MTTCLVLGIIEIIVGTCRNSPVIGITIILPMAITRSTWESEDNLIAGIIVPIESCIPAISHLILAILAIQDILSYLGTLGITVFTDIYLGIEVKTNQQGSCCCLSPLTLNGRVGTKFCFFYKKWQALLQLTLYEIESLFRLHLLHRSTCGRGNQWYIAEAIEQTKIEPCTQYTTLGCKVIELRLRESKLTRSKRRQVLYDLATLHDALETSIPFGLCITSILYIILMIVISTPFATIIPPTITGRSNQLVGSKFVEYMTALDAPISMFKRTKCGSYHIVLGIIIVA